MDYSILALANFYGIYMKLRIEGNSLRFRLRKSEVESLATQGMVSEVTNIPNGMLHYSVVLDAQRTEIGAELHENTIACYLPEKYGKTWHINEIVGFEGRIPLEDGQFLSVLIEKDFVCLDRDLAAQQDQYPHPKLSTQKN